MKIEYFKNEELSQTNIFFFTEYCKKNNIYIYELKLILTLFSLIFSVHNFPIDAQCSTMAITI